jgi:hypothetical protein
VGWNLLAEKEAVDVQLNSAGEVGGGPVAVAGNHVLKELKASVSGAEADERVAAGLGVGRKRRLEGASCGLAVLLLHEHTCDVLEEAVLACADWLKLGELGNLMGLPFGPHLSYEHVELVIAQGGVWVGGIR